MPTSSFKPCSVVGCGALTRKRWCAEHEQINQKEMHQARRASESARPSPTARGYGSKWRKLREFILSRDPICRACKRKPANHVDHIVSKSSGGTDDPSNLQGLCHGCHTRKTNAVDGGGWARVNARRQAVARG